MRKQVSITETSVGTLARGLDVLELFGSATPERSQKEISEALGLPMPTVHRLVALLTERGWLERDPATRRLRLGLELTRLIPALLAGLGLPELARPHLQRLASELQETINMAVLHGGDVVYLLSEPGDRLLTLRAPVGMRLPAHCTALGKCLLAQLGQELARATLGDGPYERRTASTLTSWRELAGELAEIDESGVAVSDEEYELGLVSIAVPVHWTEAAAINVSLPTGRATSEARARMTRRLLAAATEIDRAIR